MTPAPLLEALGALQRLPFVTRAGLADDHLRAITGPDVSAELLSRGLSTAGIVAPRVQTVEPMHEDVFLALAGE